METTKVSGLTIVRNAISNGYMIAEVIDTLAAVAEHQIVVCDGHSDDGTYEYLQTRNDIELFQDRWDLESENGLEFAKITNLGLKRCTGDYIFYLQADELIHEDQIEQLKELIQSGKYNSISCKFNHIRYDLEFALTEGYQRAARVIKNNVGISSAYDGYDFQGSGMHPQCISGVNIYHYGYVFLENIMRKMINHSDNFYNRAPNYANRKRLAQDFLKRIEAGEVLNALDLQKTLEPEYTIQKHGLPLPACMERLRITTITYSTVTKYTLPPIPEPPEPKEPEGPVRTIEDLAVHIPFWDIAGIKFTRSHRGNAWVNHRLKIACLGIPKCASTSLRNQFKMSELMLVEDIPDDYFLFSVIRNPIGRIISAYIEVVEKCRAYPNGRYNTDLELSEDQVSLLDDLMADYDDCGRFSVYLSKIQDELGFFELHCVPQIIYLTNENNQLIPRIEIFRIDRLEALEKRLGTKIQKENQSENPGLKNKLGHFVMANSTIRKQIAQLYNYDARIWEEYGL